ncbi:hypothetical protein [Sneathiella chinensis]|uniref:Uracil-DNA glycosylase-like domain-containing protein n=1 Tax=Sneathiella chinensis TaxID=349750 RepID=A0ABQ5U5D5_9PROT|nr:hypothetical protein [Sneathiella chinensis]GLQ06606.1 hypothetical protein GCM10007924_18270 [Sneathiella chinensis]
MTKLTVLSEELYAEVGKMLEDKELASVVQHGLNPLYAPLADTPDLALITFQGGGEDKSIQREAPSQLLYLNDTYRFGQILRKYMAQAGLRKTLFERTVAHAAIFPSAPTQEARMWEHPKTGPRKVWRDFSLNWNKRLLMAQSPKAILIFGDKASQAFNIEWQDCKFEHKQNHMTFGRGEWQGIPAIYCHHLSINCPKLQAVECMKEVKNLLGKL